MNSWVYDGKAIKKLSDLPENAFGFVYELTHRPSGKKYIGKKQLIYEKKRKIGKRETARLKEEKKEAGEKYWWNVPSTKIVKTESDWLEYHGSNEDILKLIEDTSYDSVHRQILEIAYSKKDLTYLEAKYQFKRDVLESNVYANTNILGKFYK